MCFILSVQINTMCSVPAGVSDAVCDCTLTTELLGSQYSSTQLIDVAIGYQYRWTLALSCWAQLVSLCVPKQHLM